MKTLLQGRKLPELKSREEMLDILQSQVYGYLPEKPAQMQFEVVQKNAIGNFCAGTARCTQLRAICTLTDGKVFSFPFQASFPTDGEKHPFFILISFLGENPNKYLPAEELIDAGFAVLHFDYRDVAADNRNFSTGLPGVIFDGRERQGSDPGKIAMWAWAAHRVMDYAQTRGDVLDLSRGCVCGHSRLGKTALLAAATDTRFAYAYSNDSGCCGAAISRGKAGETTKKIWETFPYWFCPNFAGWAGREQEMPFDQHYLLACIAPRKVLVGSASEDLWADPVAEQLCVMAAAPAFGTTLDFEKPAEIGEAFLSQNPGYHLRKGAHYFSRHDWHRLMEFIQLHS
ncbi:MAG: hypothetical protein IKJ94_06955 [Oscillospiraceae bacterium]|nr:hypothetical protein [Oscillospiraceae bacterium]